jgi:hypothetical protein
MICLYVAIRTPLDLCRVYVCPVTNNHWLLWFLMDPTINDSKLALEPIPLTTIGLSSTPAPAPAPVPASSTDNSDQKRSTTASAPAPSPASPPQSPPQPVEVVVRDEWSDRVLLIRNNHGRYLRGIAPQPTHSEYDGGHYEQWRWLAVNLPTTTRQPQQVVSATDRVNGNGNGVASPPKGGAHILMNVARYVPVDVPAAVARAKVSGREHILLSEKIHGEAVIIYRPIPL